MNLISKISNAIAAAKDSTDIETAATGVVTVALIVAMALDTPWPWCLGLWVTAAAVIILPVILAVVLNDQPF